MCEPGAEMEECMDSLDKSVDDIKRERESGRERKMLEDNSLSVKTLWKKWVHAWQREYKSKTPY